MCTRTVGNDAVKTRRVVCALLSAVCVVGMMTLSSKFLLKQIFTVSVISSTAPIDITDKDEEGISRRNRRLQIKSDNIVSEKAAIATLVSDLNSDVEQLCVALRTLIFLHGDNLERPRSDVLIFHENLTYEQRVFLRSCTDRPVYYFQVFFQKFPRNFDRFKEESSSSKVPFQNVEGRSSWGYHQMIRFWTTGIWRHPAIEPYDTIMRIDSDMCFFEGHPFLPRLATPQKVYHSYFGGSEVEPAYVEGLFEFAMEFMKSENMLPANPEMWDIIEKVKDQKSSLPIFQTSVEVSRKAFMQREDVDRWHSSLTEREPFGVYRHRWSDSVTRFLTMAMFAVPGSVQIEREQEYFNLWHRNCMRENLDSLLAENSFKTYARNFLGLSLFKKRTQGHDKIAW